MLAAALFIPVPVRALSARKALVLDPVGNQVLFSRRGEERSLIASTTKIMTGLLIAETCNVLETVTVPKEAVGIEGSSLYLREGEKLTVQELLYGMLLRSGNDAAAALAIHCAGSVPAFAELMNRRAAELGMQNSHFENPHGLDGKNHYSTAEDLGILGAAAMKNPIFARTVATKTVKIGDRYLKNHNKLLWQLPGAEGIKTGYTRSAGRILVSSVKKMGRRLITVTIDAPDDWNDHKILTDRGFSGMEEKVLIQKGEPIGTLEAVGGDRPQVTVCAGEDFSLGIRPGERADVILPGPGFLYAPVQAGRDLGKAWVLISGTPVGRISAVCGESSDLALQEEKTIWKRIFGGKP